MTSQVDALNEALACEFEAIYAYPVIAARIDSLADRALTQWKVHQDRAEKLREVLAEQSRPAVLAEPSYAMSPINQRREAEVLAQDLEQRCLAAYALMVLADEARADAVQWMSDAARTFVEFGGTLQAFPGLDLSS